MICVYCLGTLWYLSEKLIGWSICKQCGGFMVRDRPWAVIGWSLTVHPAVNGHQVGKNWSTLCQKAGESEHVSSLVGNPAALGSFTVLSWIEPWPFNVTFSGFCSIVAIKWFHFEAVALQFRMVAESGVKDAWSILKCIEVSLYDCEGVFCSGKYCMGLTLAYKTRERYDGF